MYIVPTMLTELLYPLQFDRTPLHLAAMGDHTTCVEHLLSTPGIDVNIKDEVSWSGRGCGIPPTLARGIPPTLARGRGCGIPPTLARGRDCGIPPTPGWGRGCGIPPTPGWGKAVFDLLITIRLCTLYPPC